MKLDIELFNQSCCDGCPFLEIKLNKISLGDNKIEARCSNPRKDRDYNFFNGSHNLSTKIENDYIIVIRNKNCIKDNG